MQVFGHSLLDAGCVEAVVFTQFFDVDIRFFGHAFLNELIPES